MVCRKCGTNNPAGSKFCNHCGANLVPDTKQICPNCQTPNPNHLLYCDNCGTRLAEEQLPAEETDGPDTATPGGDRPKPFSLPSRPPGETANLEVSGEIPDWLKTGEASGKGEKDADTSSLEDEEPHLPPWAQAAQEGGESWEDEEAPTLDEVSGDHKPVDDLPVWLMGEESAETIFTHDKSTDELFQASSENEIEDEETAEMAETLPDWLKGLTTGTGPLPSLAEETAQADPGELPDDFEAMLGTEQPPEAGTADQGGAETIGSFQDWLDNLEGNEETGFEAEEERIAPDPPEAGDPLATIPDWLTDLEIVEEPAEPEPPLLADEEGFPDWLAESGDEIDLLADEEEPERYALRASEVEEKEQATGETSPWSDAEEEVPAWLLEAEEETEPVDKGEEMAWLADLELDDASRPGRAEEPAKQPATQEQVSDETWEWLAELEAEAAAAPEIVPTESAGEEGGEPDTGMPATVGGTAEEEGLPWLAQEETATEAEETATPAEEIEAPAWLSSLDAETRTDRAEGLAEPALDEPEGELSDWLAGLDAEDTQAIVDAEADEEGWDDAELPEWLRAASAEDDALEALEPEAEGELPDWLEADGEEQLSLPEDEPAREAPATADDWLADLGTLEGDEDEETVPGVTPAAEIPEWLQAMAPGQTGPLGAGEESAPTEDDLEEFLRDLDEEEMPDWLALDQAGEVAAEHPAPAGEVEEAAEVPEDEDLLDWLTAHELAADEEQAPTAETVPAPEADTFEEPGPEPPLFEEAPEAEMETVVPADELPDWLDDVMFDMDEVESFTLEDEDTASFSLSAEREDLPPDLSGERLDAWEESETASESEAPAERTPLEELPEWLRPPGGIEGLVLEDDEQWTDLLGELPPAPEPAQALTEAEIPEWLQALKPLELVDDEERSAREETEEMAVSSGPLAGLRAVVPVAPIIAAERLAERANEYGVSKEQRQQAALLQQLMRTVPQQAVQPARAETSDRSLLLQLLLALLLVAAILAGFFLPTSLELQTAPAASPTEAQALIAAAAPQPVLVAFDYTPAMAGALEGQATLLLEEIAGNGSPLLVVSQSAAGLALAERTLAEVEGIDSQWLGYVPGEVVGLRRLAPCLQADSNCEAVYGQPLAPDVSTALARSALIVVLAGDRESAISWIEQVGSVVDQPLAAVVPQAVAPVLAPYYASEQLAALWSGPPAVLPGEGSETRLPTENGPTTPFALALWLAIGLLLVGNLFYLVGGAWQARREGTA